MQTVLAVASLCFLAFPLGARARDDFASPRVATLKKDLDAGKRDALDEFWKDVAKQTTPLIEPIPDKERFVLLTFLYRGKDGVKNVLVVGGVAGWNVHDCRMTRVADTDVWHKTFRVRKDARFTYVLSVNDSLEPFEKLKPTMTAFLKRSTTFKPDPLNPKKFPGILPSFVELPHAAPQPYIARQPDVPKGDVQKQKFKSAILGNERNLWIYTPADFQAKGKPYGLLVVFDGATYQSQVPTPRILDNLIAKKLIAPLVAVLVDNVNQDSRSAELPCNPKFADFLAKELVPMLREKYHVTKDPAQTVVAGSSFGGLASTYAAYRHPEVFGNVLSQSGSYWWRPEGKEDDEHEWLTRQFARAPKLPVRFYMDVGLLENGPTPGYGPSMVVVNRHFREILRAKGYDVHYAEFSGGHDYANWRGTLADGLIALLGKRE